MTKVKFLANQVIPKTPVRDRILGCVEKTEQGCWEWTLSLNRQGYGLIHINRKTCAVHRVAYETFIGPVPEGLWVLHKCDNRSCCNPEHLFLGTYRDNIDDMLAKGRQNSGERHNLAKLTWETVREIRALYQTGEYTMEQLGIKFSVSKPTIGAVTSHRYWKE